MTVPSAREALVLADQLQQDPVAHANHAVTLLGCLQEPLQEPVARAAIQALKLFFVDQHDAGYARTGRGADGSSSSSKRRKLDAAGAAAAAGSEQPESPQQLFAGWLARQYSAYVERLLRLLAASSSASLQVAALAALMECVRHEAGPATFSNARYSQLLTALLTSSSTQPEVFGLLAARYLPCADVAYYTLRTIARLAARHAVQGGGGGGGTRSDDDDDDDDGGGPAGAAPGGDGSRPSSDVSRAMFDVLRQVPPPKLPPAKKQQEERAKQQQQQEEEEEPQEQLQSWCGAAEAGLVTAAADAVASSKARRKQKQKQQQEAAGGAAVPAAPGATPVAWANAKARQRAYSDAWLAFLRTPLPDDIYKKVLLQLHSTVLPVLVDPLLLSDFLSGAVDRGGLEGMLGLNGLFTLVTRHGLEYPAFYRRLYGLLTPAAFLHKMRSQFFGLADVFLASGMVPAYTAAAFAKRLARLALTAPPAGACLCIGMLHNVIRRHPACMVLLHRPMPAGAAAAAAAGTDAPSVPSAPDVYDAAEPDPAKSRAVESSLWELAALRNHYAPQVSGLVSVLDKDLADRVRTAELDLRPLLPGSYASLLAQELGRKLRRGVPVAFYSEPPAGLFDARLLGDDLMGWELAPPAGGEAAGDDERMER